MPQRPSESPPRWNWRNRTFCASRPQAIGNTGITGLSPHAPYSVHPELLAAVIALSAAEQVPVAMHLAESREELELLRHGTGPLRVFLEELGAWDATAIPAGSAADGLPAALGVGSIARW